MKINRKISVEKWEKFSGKVEFLIRRFPFSELSGLEKVGKLLSEQFCYCIVDWKGLVDEDDKPLICNDENKLFLYDYYEDIREFVFDKIKLLNQKEVKETKN
jgi:hypothetical protein